MHNLTKFSLRGLPQVLPCTPNRMPKGLPMALSCASTSGWLPQTRKCKDLFPHFQSSRRALAAEKIIRQQHAQPVKRAAQQIAEIRLVQRQQNIRPSQRGEQDRTILARG